MTTSHQPVVHCVLGRLVRGILVESEGFCIDRGPVEWGVGVGVDGVL